MNFVSLYMSTVATPPSSTARKPVTASGILALTQSPLLFKGRANANRKTASFTGEAFECRHGYILPARAVQTSRHIMM